MVKTLLMLLAILCGEGVYAAHSNMKKTSSLTQALDANRIRLSINRLIAVQNLYHQGTKVDSEAAAIRQLCNTHCGKSCYKTCPQFTVCSKVGGGSQRCLNPTKSQAARSKVKNVLRSVATKVLQTAVSAAGHH